MIIGGKKIAAEILRQTEAQVRALPFQPVFCDILVGDDPASAQYVRMKAEAAEKIGIKFLNASFPATVTTEELVAEIGKLNRAENLCGLIAQLPLPAGIDEQRILDAIAPEIDVDCLGRTNTELFYGGQPYMVYPTAQAVMKILETLNLDLSGKQTLIIGRGRLVGRPVSFLFQQRGWPHQVATKETQNIGELMKNADVIISAAGCPNLITGDKIKSGCVVIDAGTSEAESGGIVGDADFQSVSQAAAAISPVPGGVGPVTVAYLLKNVCETAEKIKK